MIDPVRVTNFNRTEAELEELLLFCICVAGKNATTTSKNLERLLDYGRDFCSSSASPFHIIRQLSYREDLPILMKSFGFGCYNLKAKGMLQAAGRLFELKTCTVEDLEDVIGIGMKTARYFILHTRKNARVACLDTHVLRWLADYSGLEVPKHTPTRKRYLELEQVFLKVAEILNITPADLDLRIWNKSRGSHVEESLAASA